MTENRLLLQLELESFKSIARLEQDLGQLTVLVGENSAGKSSFMQAVVLASQIARAGVPGVDVSLNGADVRLGDFKHMLHSGRTADKVTISLRLRDDAAERLHWTFPRVAQRDRHLEWRLVLGAPLKQKTGASIQQATLASSLFDEELSVSLVVPESNDSNRPDRGSDLRLLFTQSLALTRAAGGQSLDLLARTFPRDGDVPFFTGALRAHDPQASVGDGQEPRRIAFVKLEGGLPTVALRVEGNKLAAARAFVTLSNPDGPMRPGLDTMRARTRVAELRADGLYDEILAAFVEWLTELDDAMRDPESLIIPPSRLSISAMRWTRRRIGLLARELAREDLGGYIERDHLARRSRRLIDTAEGVRDSLLRRIHRLGPLREDPSPWYRPGESGSGITTLGQKGEHTIAYLDQHGDDIVICPVRVESEERQAAKDVAASREMSLISAVHYWLGELGITDSLRLQPTGRVLEFDLIDPQTNDRRDLTSVGVGASQILPVVVLCLLAEPGDLVLLEQPELHLHPKPQQNLGDFLLGIAQTGRQLIVETHSEHLINRLRLRIVEQGLEENHDLIRLLYAKRTSGETSFDELRPNKFGSFDTWPEGFFDQSPRESEEIVRAAAARRRAERTAHE